MNTQLKSTFIANWKKYFQNAPLPIAVFFSDELNGAEPARKFKDHHCLIADLMKVHKGQSLAFNAENIGCGGGETVLWFCQRNQAGF